MLFLTGEVTFRISLMLSMKICAATCGGMEITMILLENLILLILLAAVYTASSYVSLSMKYKLLPAIVSALSELGAVILIAFKGASIEELFLLVLVFGCVTVLLNYFYKEKKTSAEADTEKAE